MYYYSKYRKNRQTPGSVDFWGSSLIPRANRGRGANAKNGLKCKNCCECEEKNVGIEILSVECDECDDKNQY